MIETITIGHLGAKSKARPRTNFKTGKVHKDAEYKEWQIDLDVHIRLFSEKRGSPKLSLQYLIIDLGVIHHRGDLDNLEGGIMDVMKDCDLISNDSTKHVPNLVGLSKKTDRGSTQITLIYDDPNPEITFLVFLAKRLLGSQIHKWKMFLFEIFSIVLPSKTSEITLLLQGEDHVTN